MSKIIKRHNKKVTSKPCDQKPNSNGRKKAECPMKGNCQVNDVVCNWNGREWLWKSRFHNQKLSFKHKRYPIRQHFQVTSGTGKMFQVKHLANLRYSVLRCITLYSNIVKKCFLRLYEKLEIVTYQNQKELLNNRSEFLCNSRHANMPTSSF